MTESAHTHLETRDTASAVDGGLVSQEVNQSAAVSTKAEDKSFINCREIEDWCRECRRFRPPIVNTWNALSLSLGLLVGFVTGLSSTDQKTEAAWWGVFVTGTAMSAVALVASILAMVVGHSDKVRKMMHLGNWAPVLEPLAERMERAKQKGAVPNPDTEVTLNG